MANHSTMYLDDKDIAELDAKLLEYKSSTMGAPKDGGVKNLDGIDGVLDSTSTALSALTGYLTVMFEGTTEKEVNAKFRKFKQYIAQKSFWKMSVPQDTDFFKYGKFVGQAEMPDLTDVPSYAQSSLIVKLNIQFKNAYEYSKLAIESKATGNIISVSNPFILKFPVIRIRHNSNRIEILVVYVEQFIRNWRHYKSVTFHLSSL